LLTPLARFAFAGPAPLFLVDANVRGAGKGLLVDTIATIVTGQRATVAAYTADEDELRKRITSLVLAGDRLILLDNLEGRFGCAVLDSVTRSPCGSIASGSSPFSSGTGDRRIAASAPKSGCAGPIQQAQSSMRRKPDFYKSPPTTRSSTRT
jgi:hypothetical protein